jgi:hypothetical protein
MGASEAVVAPASRRRVFGLRHKTLSKEYWGYKFKKLREEFC